VTPEYQPPVRSDLVGIEPYGAPELPAKARLNVNENPYPLSAAFSAALGEAVRDIAPELHRYPDRDAVRLRAALGAYVTADAGFPVGADQVWVANGSNEVMQHIFAAFGGPTRSAMTFDPTYSMYPEYTRESFTPLLRLPRRSDFTVDVDAARAAIEKERPTLVLVAAPNNPTGTAVPAQDLRALADAVADVNGILVVDEAYAEFRRPSTPSALELLPEFSHLIVTRTMSKAFGLAGARVGYAIAHPAIINALRIVRLPYHLSAVTQAVASVALTHRAELGEQVERIRSERDAMAVWLQEQGLQVAESDANFIMFGVFTDAHAIWQRVLDAGVLIREVGPRGWLRVSIGTPEENAMFRQALIGAVTEGQQ
jgi:histidinol-phosphate aminotransferase